MSHCISVLMCSNKFDDKFQKSVNSILDQTFTDFEFIIVANGIANDTYRAMEYFCSDKRIILVRTTLKGLPVNLNVGLSYCKSKLVCRMDADDIAYVDRLETLFRYMEENPEVIVCGSAYDVIDELGNIINSVVPVQSNLDIRLALYYKNPFCHPSIIIRRTNIDQHGGYSNYRFAQDYELWLRLSDEKNIRFANLPKKLLGYRNTGAEARGAVKAYMLVADAYFHKLIRSGNPIYIFSTIIYLIKAIFKKIAMLL